VECRTCCGSDVFRILPLLRDHHPELRYWTVVGRGNEQTVLWKVDPHRESVAVDQATLDDVGQASHEAIFSDGVPQYFKPGSDDEVLREFQRHQVEFAWLRSADKPLSNDPMP
jgi:hypothetical protein